MMLEALFSAIAEAVFGYLLQESGLAEWARAVLESGRKIFRPDLSRAFRAGASIHRLCPSVSGMDGRPL